MPSHTSSLRKFLKDKTNFPLIAAPMFLVSTPGLVIAACKSGIVGSFPALNQRTSEGFEAWLEEIGAALQLTEAAPYAVNLIVHATNPRLEDDLALCVAHKVPLIITSLGINPDVITAVHDYGGFVLHDVTTLRHAHKAAEAGVDGLIAVAAGAGGHGGMLNPFGFVNEVRKLFDGVLVLAGALSNGSDIFAAQAMGVDFAYMGTRFISTTESGAVEGYKAMICESEAVDIVYTSVVSGVPGNFFRQRLEAAGIDMGSLTAAADSKKLKRISEEAKAWQTIWSAGHGVGSIHDVPSVADLITRLKAEYDAARSRVCTA